MMFLIDTVGEIMTPIKICIYGDKSHIELTFLDTFSAFKSALQAFVNSVIAKVILKIQTLF